MCSTQPISFIGAYIDEPTEGPKENRPRVWTANVQEMVLAHIEWVPIAGGGKERLYLSLAVLV